METVGWREWVQLPELGIPGIKAKVDTGAKTSSLHAFAVRIEHGSEGDRVLFSMHPLRKHKNIVVECNAPLVDQRVVRDSGGHVEERAVIKTRLKLGTFDIEAEFTLTSRDDMIFPMLLGRRAIEAGNLLVDVSQSYVHGRQKIRNYEKRLQALASTT